METGLKVAVLGGSGAAGTAIAAELGRRGHDVRALSRGAAGASRVDVTTGEGLEGALAGVDVLIDALNGSSPRVRDARPVLVDGVTRALTAARDGGVNAVVSLSIVGAADVPLGYYGIKVEQEGVVREGGLPWTIVRATQFHSLVAMWFGAAARLGVVPAPRGVLQPVDQAVVAVAVADTVERFQPGATPAVGGPRIEPIAELAGSWRSRRGLRRPLLPLPAVGKMMKAIAAGALTDPSARREGTTFEQWLSA